MRQGQGDLSAKFQTAFARILKPELEMRKIMYTAQREREEAAETSNPPLFVGTSTSTGEDGPGTAGQLPNIGLESLMAKLEERSVVELPEMDPRGRSVPSQVGNKSAFVTETWLKKMVERAEGHFGDDIGPLKEEKQVVKKAKSKKVNAPAASLRQVGLDRNYLAELGIPRRTVDRLYRAMYVYSVGFNEVVREIMAHCDQNTEVVAHIWRTYTWLLGECENTQCKLA